MPGEPFKGHHAWENKHKGAHGGVPCNVKRTPQQLHRQFTSFERYSDNNVATDWNDNAKLHSTRRYLSSCRVHVDYADAHEPCKTGRAQVSQETGPELANGQERPARRAWCKVVKRRTHDKSRTADHDYSGAIANGCSRSIPVVMGFAIPEFRPVDLSKACTDVIYAHYGKDKPSPCQRLSTVH